MLAFKVLVFTVLVPGTVAGYLPHRILGPGGLGKILQAGGVALLGWPFVVVLTGVQDLHLCLAACLHFGLKPH